MSLEQKVYVEKRNGWALQQSLSGLAKYVTRKMNFDVLT